MCKFSEYRNLLKNVRKSRSEMRAAEVKITSYQKEYFLDEPERYYMDACINKFERVYGICLDPNAYDEHGDFTKNCALFNTEQYQYKVSNVCKKFRLYCCTRKI